jgi:hypothetical protein
MARPLPTTAEARIAAAINVPRGYRSDCVRLGCDWKGDVTYPYAYCRRCGRAKSR